MACVIVVVVGLTHSLALVSSPHTRQHECPKKANTFCSKACVHEHRLRTDGSYVRKCLLVRASPSNDCDWYARHAPRLRTHSAQHPIQINPKQVRDRGVCVGCGLDAHALYLRCRRACLRSAIVCVHIYLYNYVSNCRRPHASNLHTPTSPTACRAAGGAGTGAAARCCSCRSRWRPWWRGRRWREKCACGVRSVRARKRATQSSVTMVHVCTHLTPSSFTDTPLLHRAQRRPRRRGGRRLGHQGGGAGQARRAAPAAQAPQQRAVLERGPHRAGDRGRGAAGCVWVRVHAFTACVPPINPLTCRYTHTGLENFRTLCVVCHQHETRALMARRRAGAGASKQQQQQGEAAIAATEAAPAAAALSSAPSSSSSSSLAGGSAT